MTDGERIRAFAERVLPSVIRHPSSAIARGRHRSRTASQLNLCSPGEVAFRDTQCFPRASIFRTDRDRWGSQKVAYGAAFGAENPGKTGQSAMLKNCTSRAKGGVRIVDDRTRSTNAGSSLFLGHQASAISHPPSSISHWLFRTRCRVRPGVFTPWRTAERRHVRPSGPRLVAQAWFRI